MRIAGIDSTGTRPGRPHPIPGARRYILTDRASGDEIALDAAEVTRVIGIEIGYIDWAISVDGAFENGKWRVR